jgi:hypothetical protein
MVGSLRLVLGAMVVLGPGAAVAEPLTLNETDEGEEVITLPPEDKQLKYGSAPGTELTFYGQFNPTYQIFDDGQERTSGVVDNGNWNSRLGFRTVTPLNGATLRFRFEAGLGLRNSATISQLAKSRPIFWDRNSLRWFEVAIETGSGTFSFGQGSLASDGTAGMDISGTAVTGATDATDGFASFRFRDTDGNLTGVSVGQVNSSINGSRRFRARYDSPAFNWFVLSTSYGVNVLNENDDADYSDVALRWNGEAGDVTIQAAIGYGWEDEPVAPDRERVAGSATFLHNPTGLNLNLSAGSLKDGPQYWWVKAGWRADLIAAGTTALSVDYYSGSDFVSDGSETTTWGFGTVQSFDDISLDIYGGVKRFEFSDRSGQTYQDATGFLFGARWFF